MLSELGAEHHGLGDFDPTDFPFDPRDPAQLAEGGNFALDTRLGRLDIMPVASEIVRYGLTIA